MIIRSCATMVPLAYKIDESLENSVGSEKFQRDVKLCKRMRQSNDRVD